MKSTIIFLASMFITVLSYAQQQPEHTQYMLNHFHINPGAAGSVDGIPFMLSSRHQWVGLENAPSTQVLSVHGLSQNYGMGAMLLNDSWGNMRRTGLQLAYSYILDVSSDVKAGIGLAGSASQYTLNQTGYKPYDSDDELLTGVKESAFVPNADFGAYFYQPETWFAGLSVNNLLQSRLKLTANESEETTLNRLFCVMGGYTLSVSDVIAIEPSVLLRYTGSSPFLADINMRAIYDKHYWIGLSYRTAKEITVNAGLKYKQFIFGYSFDYTTSDLSTFTSGTHEIVAGYVFGAKNSSAALLK